jgi:hypothetical protein
VGGWRERDTSYHKWHLRLTKFYTIWLLYVYKIYSILKIQNITYRNIVDVPQVRTTTYGKRAKLCKILEVSNAIVLISLTCRVGTVTFSSKDSEEEE